MCLFTTRNEFCFFKLQKEETWAATCDVTFVSSHVLQGKLFSPYSFVSDIARTY